MLGPEQMGPSIQAVKQRHGHGQDGVNGQKIPVADIGNDAGNKELENDGEGKGRI